MTMRACRHLAGGPTFVAMGNCPFAWPWGSLAVWLENGGKEVGRAGKMGNIEQAFDGAQLAHHL